MNTYRWLTLYLPAESSLRIRKLGESIGSDSSDARLLFISRKITTGIARPSRSRMFGRETSLLEPMLFTQSVLKTGAILFDRERNISYTPDGLEASCTPGH